jgi:anti-anti-sigma factor
MPDAPAQDSIVRREIVSAPAFDCWWSDGGLDAAWVHLGGELDAATAPQLEHALDEPDLQARLVVLDLRELAFIDAAGVRTIVDASIRARQAGRRVVLLRGLPNIDRMFTLAGSSGDIEIGYVAEPAVEAIPPLGEQGLAS